MIERHKLLYLFLCIVPFFNIIVLHTNTTFILVLTFLFLSFNLAIFKTKQINIIYVNYLFIFCALIIILIISQMHSLIVISSSNMQAIRFFGLFLPISMNLVIFLVTETLGISKLLLLKLLYNPLFVVKAFK